jgi:hypothetical protein
MTAGTLSTASSSHAILGDPGIHHPIVVDRTIGAPHTPRLLPKLVNLRDKKVLSGQYDARMQLVMKERFDAIWIVRIDQARNRSDGVTRLHDIHLSGDQETRIGIQR